MGFLYLISRMAFEASIRVLFRIHTHGDYNLPRPPFILAANHESFIDPPLLGISCKKYQVHFMAKKEFFDMPVMGKWFRAVGCIEVKRGGINISSLKDTINRLKKGQVVGIFPEGTRSTDGELQEAKRGTGFLIVKAGVPVIPLYIKNSGVAMPKGKPIKPGTRVDMYIGSPVVFGADTGDYAEIANTVMRHISQLREYSQSTAVEKAG